MSQRILRLVSENVKRLVAVDLAIDPKAGLVLIKGDNANGKSSVLDTIAYVIGGKRVQPPEVIRKGETYARGLLETEDLVVERKWTIGKAGKVVDTIEVRSKEGASFKSPQTMLDGLISRLSFDPLHFLGLDPKEQAEALRKIVGLDFSKLDGMRLTSYTSRTEANRELASLQKRLEAMPPQVGRFEQVDVAALLADREVAQAAKDHRWHLEQEANAARVARANAEVLVKEAEAAMARAYGRLKESKATEAARVSAFELCPTPLPGRLAELASKIATAADQNEKARKQLERDDLAAKVKAAEHLSAKFDAEIAAIDLEKRTLTEAAAFPVPGLGFGEVGVTFQGLPLEQASGAERIRVSTGIGFALNPELKVLRIKDGSLLDAKSLDLLDQLATAANGQIWLEIVGKAGLGIVIEAGEVESIDGAPAAAKGAA